MVRAPRLDATVELSGQTLVADGQTLPHQVDPVLVLVDDEHQRLVAPGKPSQPTGELRAQRDRQGAGDVAGGEPVDRPHVDDGSPVRHEAPDRAGVEWLQARPLPVDLRTDAVDLAELEEIGREGAEAGQETSDEGVLVGRVQQRVRRSFAADRGHTTCPGGDRAERPGAVGWVHGDLVGQAEQPLVDRGPQRPGQLLGTFGADEVGARHRPGEQRPAAEQGARAVAVAEQVREVFGRVAGGGQRFEREASEIHGLPRNQPVMRMAEPRAARREHSGTPCRQLSAAGDEVGVEMRLGRRRERQAPPLRLGEIRADVAHRVDHHGRSVAQVHQVGTVAQTLVDQGHDVGGAHRGRRQPWPTATGSPAFFHSGKPSSSRRAT